VPSISIGSFRANSWQVEENVVNLTRAWRQPDTIFVEARPQTIGIDLVRSALIVIDMQNDFCAPGGWSDQRSVDIEAARAPIGPLNRLIPELRLRSVPVIWLNWGNRPDRANLPPNLLHAADPTGVGVGLGDRLDRPDARVLEGGTWSTAIVDELDTDVNDLYIRKYRQSGFWDTGLDSILRNLGVFTLMFSGVNIDQCVLGTLMDAAYIGYDCVLLTDCSATSSPQYCTQATIYNVERSLGFVTESSAVIRAMSTAGMRNSGRRGSNDGDLD
jgi:nicotinamidase-related amidase